MWTEEYCCHFAEVAWLYAAFWSFQPSCLQCPYPLSISKSKNPQKPCFILLLILFRWGSYRNLPTTVPPGAADHRQGGRCQQLRPRPLHRRQGDCWCRPWQNPEVGRSVHRSPRIPHLPQFRRRNRFRFLLPAHGATLCGLRKEIQVRVCCVPGTPG